MQIAVCSLQIGRVCWRQCHNAAAMLAPTAVPNRRAVSLTTTAPRTIIPSGSNKSFMALPSQNSTVCRRRITEGSKAKDGKHFGGAGIDRDILVCPIRTGGRDATPFVPKRTQPRPAELSGLATGSAAVLDTGSRAAKKMPRVSGAEYFGGTSDDRICGTIDK